MTNSYIRKKQKEPMCECIFEGQVKGENWMPKEYPCWRYHRILDPLLVQNKEEDDACRLKGYDEPCAPVTSNKQLMNWYWDLEDMSIKQLRVFAQDEFGIDLPEDAKQETLMKAVTRLSRVDPRNEGRMVFMAHSMQMNYDAQIEEIKRMSGIKSTNENYDVETTTEVFEG